MKHRGQHAHPGEHRPQRARQMGMGPRSRRSALLVYAPTGRRGRAVQAAGRTRHGERRGRAAPDPLVAPRSRRSNRFGFVDGISQPIIRGSYQATARTIDPSRRAGESSSAILTIAEIFPRAELSPLLDRRTGCRSATRAPLWELGRRGARALARNAAISSFAARTDVKSFWTIAGASIGASTTVAAALRHAAAYVAAKLVGRWPTARRWYAILIILPKGASERRRGAPNGRPPRGMTRSPRSPPGRAIGSETVRTRPIRPWAAR